MKFEEIPMAQLNEHIGHLRESAAVVMIFSGTVDLKLAIECGYAVLLGKPIVMVIREGSEIPDLLRKLPNVVEWIWVKADDMRNDHLTEEAKTMLSKAMSRILAEQN